MIWLSLLGCPQELNCDALGPPSLELGQGAVQFAALSPGDPMEPEWGPQGGRHVWGALRTEGVFPGAFNLLAEDEVPTILAELLSDDGQLTFDTYEGPLMGGPVYELAGLQLVLPFDMPTDVAYAVRVEDACGSVLEEQMDVVIPSKKATLQ
ncbi:MAG: hypothetical protein KTR31_23430 [Myxococcales bacterium]|nr:hypothetical protein [Myxococcales bacterium]